jgi:hypothetical protein
MIIIVAIIWKIAYFVKIRAAEEMYHLYLISISSRLILTQPTRRVITAWTNAKALHR